MKTRRTAKVFCIHKEGILVAAGIQLESGLRLRAHVDGGSFVFCGKHRKQECLEQLWEFAQQLEDAGWEVLDRHLLDALV